MALLTAQEAAARLRISTRTLRRWIKADRLKVSRIGRTIRIDEKDVAELVSSCRT